MRHLFKIFVEHKLAYYKLFSGLGIRTDDVIGQGKSAAGIGDIIEDYLKQEFT